MSNWVISQIRTFVPILVGAIITWIFKKTGFVIDEETGAQAVLAATAGIIALYYFIVHWLEQKWPVFGNLLGKQTLPYYDVVPPTDDAVGIQVDGEAGAVTLAAIALVLECIFFVVGTLWFIDNAGWLWAGN